LRQAASVAALPFAAIAAAGSLERDADN
jgi:hypothetical protein